MRIIGSGGYGHVYEVRRKTMDRNVYAIKIIKLLDRYACRVQHLYIRNICIIMPYAVACDGAVMFGLGLGLGPMTNDLALALKVMTLALAWHACHSRYWRHSCI